MNGLQRIICECIFLRRDSIAFIRFSRVPRGISLGEKGKEDRRGKKGELEKQPGFCTSS